MRMTLLAMISVFVLAVVTADNVAAQDHSADPRSAYEHFIKAFNALDWDAFRSCFAASASLFNPDIPEAVSLHRLDGRADIECSFRAVFAAAHAGASDAHGPNINPENVRWQQFADTAVVTFEFKRSEHSVGRRTIVFGKQGGVWLIEHVHASNVTM